MNNKANELRAQAQEQTKRNFRLKKMLPSYRKMDSSIREEKIPEKTKAFWKHQNGLEDAAWDAYFGQVAADKAASND